ncbi:MAG: translation initiation factor IF-2 [Candidatus Paceibacterota bacterium]
MPKTQTQPNKLSPRPPVICVMGHVDHGKSTLLDYIRKTNVVEGEAGGITQKLSAYEVEHRDGAGKVHRLTFLDTPGHESFCQIRTRGADVADVAILVVSAEDGVKPQTLDALRCILVSKIPYVVAINKIDKPNADLERAKQSLAENEIYVEGYGGSIPCVPISAKTGVGVGDLLDLIILSAEMEERTADYGKLMTGVVIETAVDSRRGISATIIIKDGTWKQGEAIVAGESISPGRIVENFAGKKVGEATFSSPIKVVGFDSAPPVGSLCQTFKNKREAEAFVEDLKEKKLARLAGAKPVSKKIAENGEEPVETTPTLPIILKADLSGSLEALGYEVGKIKSDRVVVKIISQSVGDITESDIKAAGGKEGTLLVGFNVSADARAKAMAERIGIEIKTFDIIYQLTDWLKQAIIDRTPKKQVEAVGGQAKILKIFSTAKGKYILGGRVEEGAINLGDEVKIVRRENELGKGKVKNLQQGKKDTKEVLAGNEFGAQIESSIEIAPGDRLIAVKLVMI